MENSFFSRYDLQHLCKVSSDGSVIFYTDADYLVFLTIVFTFADRYGINVTGLCIMRNHFHIVAYSSSAKSLNSFYQQICAQFVRYYNGREGKVKICLKPKANISSKHGDKYKKTLYIYVCNNPVEKKACSLASDYKWNFFEKIDYEPIAEESGTLSLAKAIVRDSRKAQRPLRYEFFNHFEDILSEREFDNLKNYILSLYVKIDSSEVARFFGSVKDFLKLSSHYYGSDYDIKEDYTKEDYQHYDSMTEVLERRGLHGNDMMSPDQQYNAILDIAHLTNASCIEISRFLHVPMEKVQDITGRRF